ncbi:UDP-2,3-diacylglucosamine diphosphatase [Glaciecola sp. 1036]|uniref:UDP-2,3-diacylglucosamine diphosphatase n=1 Tax=Alteromonadaceae TaxID=72275 RepID=UPI003D07F3C0
MQTIYSKSVFISDLHLGSLDCKAEMLLDFLNRIQCENLYLVGDIVDMWAMSRQFRWPELHNQIMHKIFQISRTKTKVYYLPGNHDEPLQKYSGFEFANIKIARELIHTSADNKQYLVFHGDQCDGDVQLGKFEAWIGDKGYSLLLALNRWYHLYKQKTGQNYWSLAGYIKSRIRGAGAAITQYKKAAAEHAKRKKLHGVICGHIHHPESDQINGIHYLNDGDWVENCTALLENHQGEFSLMHYTEHFQSNVQQIDKKLPKRAA